MARQSVVPRGVPLQGVLVVEGTAARCFVRLRADGNVSSAGWCRAKIPGLNAAATWRRQGEDLVLLSADGAVVLQLRPAAAGIWRAATADGASVVFHQMIPQVSPH